MKLLLVVLALAQASVAAGAQDGSPSQLIQEALLPLPQALRADATVVLAAEPGERVVLRSGTNHIICRADAPTPGFKVRCHHKELDPLFTKVEELVAEGASDDEIGKVLDAEIKAGRVKAFHGATEYMLIGPNPAGALPIMTVWLPAATSASTGLSTEPSNYRPWLMWAGTAAAHIMIPGK